MLNKVILIGNVTKDPELKETQSGVSVCKFSIAVNREYKKSDGERETDFFNLIAWRTLGETCAKYLQKGNKVAVTGRLENRTYEDKEGVKRTVTDIIVEGIEFLTPRENKAEGETTSVKKTRSQLEPIDDNMLPF